MGIVVVAALAAAVDGGANAANHVYPSRNELAGERRQAIELALRPALFNGNIAPGLEPVRGQSFKKYRESFAKRTVL
jgi:hypothetical protein